MNDRPTELYYELSDRDPLVPRAAARRILVFSSLLCLSGLSIACADTGGYSSVHELGDALNGIGFACSDLDVSTNVLEGVTVETAECMVEPPSGDLELAVFDSGDDLERALEDGDLVEDSADPVVIGDNWIVAAETDEWAEQIADGLGGRLVPARSR